MLQTDDRWLITGDKKEKTEKIRYKMLQGRFRGFRELLNDVPTFFNGLMGVSRSFKGLWRFRGDFKGNSESFQGAFRTLLKSSQ